MGYSNDKHTNELDEYFIHKIKHYKELIELYKQYVDALTKENETLKKNNEVLSTKLDTAILINKMFRRL